MGAWASNVLSTDAAVFFQSLGAVRDPLTGAPVKRVFIPPSCVESPPFDGTSLMPSTNTADERKFSNAAVIDGSTNVSTEPVGTHSLRIVPLGRSINTNLCGDGSPASARSADVSHAASGVAAAARKNQRRERRARITS